MTHPGRNEESALLELDRYGIEVVPAKSYMWGGYRYTNARDALAAAKRGEKK
jgi:hypothetical protein